VVVSWQDTGILIGSRKLGESKLILTLFTQSNGLAKGVHRPSKKKQSAISLGASCACNWQARLESQLGHWQLEVMRDPTAHLIFDPIKIDVLQYVCQLLTVVLPERHSYPELYQEFEVFLTQLLTEPIKAMVVFELCILESLGYGFTLDSCAATGQSEELYWLSPKSCQAVSYAAGLPYQDKLFKLPTCMIDNKGDFKSALWKTLTDNDEVLLLGQITECFIEKYFAGTPKLTELIDLRRMILRKVLKNGTKND
tara:strand:+ start:26395 stop:27156 length:762 start_codon:yes stop_codon:yes gene_type:complete